MQLLSTRKSFSTTKVLFPEIEEINWNELVPQGGRLLLGELNHILLLLNQGVSYVMYVWVDSITDERITYGLIKLTFVINDKSSLDLLVEGITLNIHKVISNREDPPQLDDLGYKIKILPSEQVTQTVACLGGDSYRFGAVDLREIYAWSEDYLGCYFHSWDPYEYFDISEGININTTFHVQHILFPYTKFNFVVFIYDEYSLLYKYDKIFIMRDYLSSIDSELIERYISALLDEHKDRLTAVLVILKEKR